MSVESMREEIEEVSHKYSRTKPVWSMHACELCKVIKKAKPKSLAKTTSSIATHGDIKNPALCPYGFVKINGILYHRSEAFFSGLSDFEAHNAIIKNIRCHDCGIAAGFVHHVGCDCEQCPKCGSQFILCGHNGPIIDDDINVEFLTLDDISEEELERALPAVVKPKILDVRDGNGDIICELHESSPYAERKGYAHLERLLICPNCDNSDFLCSEAICGL